MAGIKQKGGTVNNPTGGTITGYNYGVEIYGLAGTVTNNGTIGATGAKGIGVELLDGGSVTKDTRQINRCEFRVAGAG